MDTNTESNDIPVEDIESELDTLKRRADIMSIKYHPKIGVDKLKAKIKLHLDLVTDNGKTDIKERITNISSPLTKAQYDLLQSKNHRKAAGALVRIRVTCMNPDKKAWPGETFSAGSAKLGTFKKYVPFKSEHPYHVPKIIYDMMKERKFTVFKEVMGARGNKVTKGHLIPEFAIEILDQLTPQEIKDLANQQAKAGTI